MKKLFSCLFVIFFMLATTAPAYAYLDGGTGSILLQTLFAGAAGCIAILKLYWYKIKMVFTKGKADLASDEDKTTTAESN
jgi:hypothetical protein